MQTGIHVDIHRSMHAVIQAGIQAGIFADLALHRTCRITSRHYKHDVSTFVYLEPCLILLIAPHTSHLIISQLCMHAGNDTCWRTGRHRGRYTGINTNTQTGIQEDISVDLASHRILRHNAGRFYRHDLSRQSYMQAYMQTYMQA